MYITTHAIFTSSDAAAISMCMSTPCLTCRYTIRPRPQKLALNSNSSLVAVIDSSGVLSVLDLEAKVNQNKAQGKPFEMGRVLNTSVKNFVKLVMAGDFSQWAKSTCKKPFIYEGLS